MAQPASQGGKGTSETGMLSSPLPRDLSAPMHNNPEQRKGRPSGHSLPVTWGSSHTPSTDLLFPGETISPNDLPHFFLLLDLWVAFHHVYSKGERSKSSCSCKCYRKKGTHPDVAGVPLPKEACWVSCRVKTLVQSSKPEAERNRGGGLGGVPPTSPNPENEDPKLFHRPTQGTGPWVNTQMPLAASLSGSEPARSWQEQPAESRHGQK